MKLKKSVICLNLKVLKFKEFIIIYLKDTKFNGSIIRRIQIKMVRYNLKDKYFEGLVYLK